MSTSILDSFKKDGYVLIKNVFTVDEMDELNQISEQHFQSHGMYKSYGKNQPNCALEMPKIAPFLFHEKIASALQKVLETEDVILTGSTGLLDNMVSGWHKDDGQGDYFPSYRQENMYTEPCSVVKVGVYFQDPAGSTGLVIREGSHKVDSLVEGPIKELSPRMGDILIFDVRITHRSEPMAFYEKVMMKLSSRVLSEKKSTKLYSSLRSLRNRTTRRMLTVCYGINNQVTEDYSRETMRKQLRLIQRTAYYSSEELKKLSKGSGIGLSKIYDELEHTLQM